MPPFTTSMLFKLALKFLLLIELKSLVEAKISGSKSNSRPFGFGHQTTGGDKANPQAPKSLAELETWLGDKVPRVILIDRTFDFTQVGSIVTGAGCAPFPECKNGNRVQYARAVNDWCKPHKSKTVTYHPKAVEGLQVSSHKTILGVDDKGVIKGAGLILNQVENVIIQNVKITWLNPHLVWGGDGIHLWGAKNVWIDHCTFSYIGRQMIVLGAPDAQHGNQGITISNNLLAGKTKWSATCDNKHYWTFLIHSADDQITVANNCIESTSGRSPSIKCQGNSKVFMHHYNNLHTNSHGPIFNVHPGANILAEGNVFINATINSQGQGIAEEGGSSFAPFTSKIAHECDPFLKRSCMQNAIKDSSKFQFGTNIHVLKALSKLPTVAEAKILSASHIQTQGAKNCGVGNL